MRKSYRRRIIIPILSLILAIALMPSVEVNAQSVSLSIEEVTRTDENSNNNGVNYNG